MPFIDYTCKECKYHNSEYKLCTKWRKHINQFSSLCKEFEPYRQIYNIHMFHNKR